MSSRTLPVAVVGDWIKTDQDVHYVDGRRERIERHRVEARVFGDRLVPILEDHDGPVKGWIRAIAVIQRRIHFVGLVTDPNLAGRIEQLGLSPTCGGKGEFLSWLEVSATRRPAASGTAWRVLDGGLTGAAEAAAALLSADRGERAQTAREARQIALAYGYDNWLDPEVRAAIRRPVVRHHQPEFVTR